MYVFVSFSLSLSLSLWMGTKSTAMAFTGVYVTVGRSMIILRMNKKDMIRKLGM